MTDFDRAWATLLDACKKPYPELARTDLKQVAPDLDPLAGLGLPAVNRAGERYALDSAMTLGLALMGALEAYRLEHGHYPDGLKDLVPDYLSKVPLDPFTADKPLVYSRTVGAQGLAPLQLDGNLRGV